jgi:hypothetical protein
MPISFTENREVLGVLSTGHIDRYNVKSWTCCRNRRFWRFSHSDDYASYNTTGGGYDSKNDKRSDADSKYKPTGKIAAGQAFFATGSSAAEVWQVLRIV